MNHPLYTIGYEGARIDEFVETLLEAGVQTLVDVRDVPISRKKGFSKSILRETLADHGIEYVHLRGLGDPKPGREAARSGDFPRFREIFGAHMKTQCAQLDLEIAGNLAKDIAICLMCFERDHCTCHRSIVAHHIVGMTGLRVHNLAVERKSARHESSLFNGQRSLIPLR
jgi:uncharacterized protein (DUF488 family)